MNMTICEKCKKEIKGKIVLGMFYVHPEGFLKNEQKACTEECQREKDRVKEYCENCFKTIPDITEPNVCCGHIAPARTDEGLEPGWFRVECTVCGLILTDPMKIDE